MFNRLRQDDGFTLPELLVTLVIGLTVTLATLSLVEVTMRRTGDIAARTEAVQSGRTGMELITRQLRSQVCLQRVGGTVDDPRRSLLLADPNSMTLYVDMRDTSNKTGSPSGFSGPEKHQLTYVPSVVAGKAGQITETSWKSTSIVGGLYQFATTPSTRVILNNVEPAPVRDAAGKVVKDAGGNPVVIPIFQFYKYDFTLATPQPTAQITGTLTDAQIKQVAKIKITYKAQPTQKRKDDAASTVFTNDVFVRTVDPNAETSELSNPCL